MNISHELTQLDFAPFTKSGRMLYASDNGQEHQEHQEQAVFS